MAEAAAAVVVVAETVVDAVVATVAETAVAVIAADEDSTFKI